MSKSLRPLFDQVNQGLERGDEIEVAHAMSLISKERRALRASAMDRACLGADAGHLVLLGFDWSGLWLDGIAVGGPPVEGPKGGYREPANGVGRGPHGFHSVCPGRHTVASWVMGRHWTRSILVFPRETQFLPLDPTHTSRPAPADLVLWSYRDVIAIPLMTSDAARMSEEAMSVALGHLRSALRAQTQGEPIELSNNLELASRALDGAPIDSFEPLTSLIGFQAFEHVAKGSIEWARAVTQLGLALLPDHPILLGILGELELREGKTELGRLTLGRAFERDAGLDERMRARIESLIAPSTA